MPAAFQKTEARAWAKETMKGCANVVIASYTNDLSGLNEAGIRHDVRWEIERGFWGALLVSETSLTADEYIRFTEVAVDEAQGKLHFLYHASSNTLEENIAVANRADAAGSELVLLSYPPSFYPNDSEDIYNYTKAFCDGTDMAVMLFPVPLWNFERIHGAALDPHIIDRLVDVCPNIVAVKAEGGFPSIGGFADCYNRVGDRVIVTMPVEDQAIPLKTLVDLPWMGTSYMEYFGDSVPRMFNLLEAGKTDEAWDLFWKIDPARRAGHQVMGIQGSNFAHRMTWKYMGWLNGMNGGPLRMPTMRTNANAMATMRGGLAKSGIPCTEDTDDQFFIGRVQG